MAEFSKQERLIASLLSSSPKLKKWIKRFYIMVNAVIYHKPYAYKILHERILGIEKPCEAMLPRESFFGYYDKSPLNSKGMMLAYLSTRPTSRKPSSKEKIAIAVIDILGKKTDVIDFTSSYNWQQGARAHWLTDDKVVYNSFLFGAYKALVYSVSERKVIGTYEFPVQDSYKDEFFLSINYQRIMRLRPDYGYRNLPALSDVAMRDLDSDGIWKIEYQTGESVLLHSLREIVDCEYRDDFMSASHKVNHVMINPNGDSFIFIHRYYKGGRRFDRLMFSDFRSVRVLADDGMVSHYSWVDNHTIFVYMRYNGSNGFYFCDIKENKVTPCDVVNNVVAGDGHPTCHGDKIVFDTYPDKSGMQTLYVYNMSTREVSPLVELHHGLKYSEQCRCDLHPRFSTDGRLVFFDTVFSGKRSLCYIRIEGV